MIAHHNHGTEALHTTRFCAFVGAVHIHKLQGVGFALFGQLSSITVVPNGRSACQLIASQKLLQDMPAEEVRSRCCQCLCCLSRVNWKRAQYEVTCMWQP